MFTVLGGTARGGSALAPGVSLDCEFQRAVRMHQAGAVEAAARSYENIVKYRLEHAGAWHLLGVARHQQGHVQAAIDCIQRALALDSSSAIYRNNYGAALRAAGRLEDALAALQQAVAIKPVYADAHANLGLVLCELGSAAQGMNSLRRALELAPRHFDALRNLANHLQQSGQHREAIVLYRQALEVNPRHPETHNDLGNALLAQQRAAEAVACYERALALNPRFAQAQLNLSTALAEQERIPEAASAAEAAARLRPDNGLWRLRPLGLCPTVFQTVEEIDVYRRTLEANLDEAARTSLSVDEAELTSDGFAPSFNLAHHGRSNRRLLEKFAALFRPHIRRRQPCIRNGKPRIGFLVTAPHVGSFVRTMGGIVERLDSRRFHVVVLCSASAIDSLRTRLCRSDVDWISFPHNFRAAADRVLSAGCDAIYYHKVSADPLGYLLPFARLARVQCTSWTTHYTSGVREVDYFVSSDLCEVAVADGDYTERLVRLGTLPFFERAPADIPPATRGQLGLPVQGGLYLCPQRLAKFHPAQDTLLRGVLEADRRGHLVLLAGKHAGVLQQLVARFQRTLGDTAKRVLVLPDQSPQDLQRLLSVGDALLDMHHYSASLIAYDAFAADLPVVTLPGRFKVERYVQGYYRRMGIQGAVASSPKEYVAMAARLGTDAAYRDDCRAEIRARKGLLFEDMQAVRDYEQFFEAALQHEAPVRSEASSP